MATLKAQWIAGLKDELKQARAHLKRWRDLGKRFGKTHTQRDGKPQRPCVNQSSNR